MKNKLYILIALLLIVVMTAGCAVKGTDATPGVTEKNRPLVRVGTLKGPTGIGMVKLMEDNAAKTTANEYKIDIYTAPTDLVGLISNGDIDIAAVPTNLAATLYNKTNGNVQMMASITLGVLYILEKGDTVHSIADLKGKTIYTSGQGSTPEYALRYILTQNGIDPDKDVTIEYKAEHTELSTLALAGKADIVMLPEPFVTTVLNKDAGFRIAVDLNDAWKTASADSSIFSMGALIVRKDFVQNNKEALEAFISEYKASTNYVNENTEVSAQLVEKYGIIASKEIAQKAIPNCNNVYIDGSEMKVKIDAYLKLLHGFDPKSVGGKLPDENFYYQK